MRSRPFRLVPALVAVMLLMVPALAAAQDVTPQDIAINSIWVIVAAILVLFMQAGFAMLEVGLSRMKNAGAVMGKILINLSISFLMFWAVGFSFAFGTGNDFIGSSGWLTNISSKISRIIGGPCGHTRGRCSAGHMGSRRCRVHGREGIGGLARRDKGCPPRHAGKAGKRRRLCAGARIVRRTIQGTDGFQPHENPTVRLISAL